MNTNMEPVSQRIGSTIVEFYQNRMGTNWCEFHADDLREYVTSIVGRTAPGSSDRILRSLRQAGLVNYDVIDRAKSLYSFTPLSSGASV